MIVEASAAKIWVIARCTRLIRDDDWRAGAIENIAERGQAPELEDAKKLARAVSR